MSQKITVNCRPDSTCEPNTLTGQVSIPTADEVRKTPGLAETLVRMVETAITVPVQSKMRAASRKADGIAGDQTYETAKKAISAAAKKAAFDACASFDWAKVGLVQRGPVGETKSKLAVSTCNALVRSGKIDSAKTKAIRHEASDAWTEGNHAKVRELLSPLHADIAEVYEPKEDEKE